MFRTHRAIAALTAVTVFAPGAVAVATPKKPSARVIKKLLGEAYCPDTTAPNGNVIETAKVELQTVKRAKARPGNIVREGVPKGTKVFPIRITFVCDYSNTAAANPDSVPQDLRSKGSFIFYKDEFGDWQQKNSGIETTQIDGR